MEKKKKRKRIRRIARCGMCAIMIINGVACHEIGCVDRHIDPLTGRPYPTETG